MIWKNTFISRKMAEVSELQAGWREPSCLANPCGEDGGEGAEFVSKLPAGNTGLYLLCPCWYLCEGQN